MTGVAAAVQVQEVAGVPDKPEPSDEIMAVVATSDDPARWPRCDRCGDRHRSLDRVGREYLFRRCAVH